MVRPIGAAYTPPPRSRAALADPKRPGAAAAVATDGTSLDVGPPANQARAEARLSPPSASQGVLSPPGVAPPRAGKGPVGPADVRMESARGLESTGLEKGEGREPPAALGGGTVPRAAPPARPWAGAAPPREGDRKHAVDPVASPGKDSFVVGDVWMGAAHAGSQAALQHADRFAASLGGELKPAGPPGPPAAAGEKPRPDADSAPGQRQLATPPDFPADRGFGRGTAAAPPGAPSTRRTAAQLGTVPGRRNATEIADGSSQRASVQWGGHAGPADTTGVATEGSGSAQVAASEGVPTPEPMVATGRGTALYSGGRGASGGDPGASVKRWARADNDLRAAAKERGDLQRKREEKQGAMASAEKARLDAAAAKSRAGNAAERAKAERAENAAHADWIAAKHEIAKIDAGIEEQRGKERRARVERDWNGDRLDAADKKAAAALSQKMDDDPASKRRREREERAEQRLKDAEARADQRRERKGEAWNRHREERQERLREKRREREERQEAARKALALSPSDFAKWRAARQTVRFLEGAIREQRAILDDPKATSEEKAAARREIKELEGQQAIARADQQWIDEGGFPLHELDCCDPAYARCRPPCLPEQRCDCVKPEHCGPSKKTPGESGKGGDGGVPPGLREETVTAARDSAAPAEEPEGPEDSKPGVAPPRRGGARGRDGGAASPVSPEATPETQTIEPPKPPDVPDDDGKGDADAAGPTRKRGTFVEEIDDDGKRVYAVPDMWQGEGGEDEEFGTVLPSGNPCKRPPPPFLVLWEKSGARRVGVIRDADTIRFVWDLYCLSWRAGDRRGRLEGLNETVVELVDPAEVDLGALEEGFLDALFAELAKWGEAGKDLVKEQVEALLALPDIARAFVEDPRAVIAAIPEALAGMPGEEIARIKELLVGAWEGDRKAILTVVANILGGVIVRYGAKFVKGLGARLKKLWDARKGRKTAGGDLPPIPDRKPRRGKPPDKDKRRRDRDEEKRPDDKERHETDEPDRKRSGKKRRARTHGDEYNEVFQTSKGPVELDARLLIEGPDGKTVHLSDVMAFPVGAERRNLGATEVLRILRQQIGPKFKAQGFQRMRITGDRISGAKALSGKADRGVDFTVDL